MFFQCKVGEVKKKMRVVSQTSPKEKKKGAKVFNMHEEIKIFNLQIRWAWGSSLKMLML